MDFPCGLLGGYLEGHIIDVVVLISLSMERQGEDSTPKNPRTFRLDNGII
jgi:hypothetical protein